MSLERVVDCAAGASPLEIAHHIQRTSGSSDDTVIETLLAAAGQTIHLGSKVELLTAALQRLPATGEPTLPRETAPRPVSYPD